MKKIILLIILLCLTYVGCVKKIQSKNKTEKGWRDFSDLDIKLKGVVYYVNKNINKGFFHGRGIIRIKIIETNTEYYDPRKKQLNYFCIIKNNKAELYDTNVNETEIGDTIVLNTTTQNIKWIKKSKENKVFSISIGEVDFFDYIKENKLQEF